MWNSLWQQRAVALFWVSVVLVLLCTDGLMAAGPPLTHSDKDGWLKVPDAFLVSRLVSPATASPLLFRATVDVPPSPSLKAIHPRIVHSTEDEAIDGIASEYVRHVLQISRTLAQQNRARSLRFKLRIVPVHLDFKELHAGFTPRASELNKSGYYTPLPEYPGDAFRADVGGTCTVRAFFGPEGGRPILVALEAGSGNEYLDRAAVLTAQLWWYGPKKLIPNAISVSVTFVNFHAYG